MELEITSEPDPAALRDAVGRIGEELGTFQTEPSELAGIRLESTQAVLFDASAGLVRRVEQVREVVTPTETLEVRDAFEIHPSSP